MFEHPDNKIAAALHDLQEQARHKPAPFEDLLDDPDLTPTWDMGPPSDPPDIKDKSESEAINLMVEWFHSNFEDLAHEKPWVDGGYCFVWGGPYDAREELEYTFGAGASDKLIDGCCQQTKGRRLRMGTESIAHAARARRKLAYHRETHAGQRALALREGRERRHRCQSRIQSLRRRSGSANALPGATAARRYQAPGRRRRR